MVKRELIDREKVEYITWEDLSYTDALMMACIYDEPLKPYICEANWNCKDCPNWVKSEDNQEDKGGIDGNDD